MKNCADSAAQAMSMAATRMDGAVQRTDHGPAAAIGSAARSSSGVAYATGLTESDFIASGNARMFLEIRARDREVHAKMRAAALFARQRAACDEQRHGVDVAQFVHRQGCIRDWLRSLGAQ